MIKRLRPIHVDMYIIAAQTVIFSFLNSKYRNIQDLCQALLQKEPISPLYTMSKGSQKHHFLHHQFLILRITTIADILASIPHFFAIFGTVHPLFRYVALTELNVQLATH